MRRTVVGACLLLSCGVCAEPPTVLNKLCQLYSPNDVVDQTPVSDYSVKVGKIEVNNQPIFDESLSNTLFIHRFANWLHYTTRKSVILEQLSVQEGETVTNLQLEEAERILRNKPFIRDAQISYSDTCDTNEPQDITVTTWDTWSLLPTLDFGRSSGANKFALGVKEENLLGFGIRSSLKFKSDNQRSGFHLVLSAPLPWNPQSTSTLIVDNNDDGHLYLLRYDKPFYQMTSHSMQTLSVSSERKNLNVFHNTVIEDVFEHNDVNASAQYGWLSSFEHLTTSRYLIGIDYVSQTFTVPSESQQRSLSATTPKDFRRLIPWAGWHYKQHFYKVMQDIYLTNQNEDINLGVDFLLKAGPIVNHDALSSWMLHSKVSTGWGMDNILVLGAIQADMLLNTELNDRASLKASAEYFLTLSDTLRFYSKAAWQWQNKVFDEQALALGGETGLRGFPQDYQHGTQVHLLTNELRYYPKINIYQFVDVAMVGFVDVGKASGDSRTPNLTDAWLGSVGLGLRLYSARSTNDNVIHIDFTTPLNAAPGVDSWELGFSVSNRF